MTDLIAALRGASSDDAVLDSGRIADRATSYWNNAPMRAAALVRPRTTAELSAVLKLCNERGQSVVTHGGLTGCVEGAITRSDDVVISLERMNAIEEIDAIGRTATVQAGVVLQKLQQTVKEQGLYFPLDLGARGSCTIGGNVATNAGGINVIRYGMMRQRVLGLEAVLADGTIVSSMNRMLKNNAGYDLKQLFIGSEGTLGIVTRVIVQLEEAPISRNSAMLALDSFAQVTALLKLLQRRLGGQLCAYEVMWGEYFHTVTSPGRQRAPMGRDHAYYVMLEAEGAQPESDEAAFVAVLEDAMEQELIVNAVIAQSESERRALWEIRENFEAVFLNKPIFLYDVSLPIRDMDGYIREVQQRLKQRWPDSICNVIGHIGDGNLHLFVHPGVAGEGLHTQSDDDVYAPLQAIGGSISAEHGIGTEKRARLPISRSAIEIELMRTLKRSLDPNNILNRGKVVELQSAGDAA
jgi:FAD/FMN-containing dehydrogenase